MAINSGKTNPPRKKRKAPLSAKRTAAGFEKTTSVKITSEVDVAAEAASPVEETLVQQAQSQEERHEEGPGPVGLTKPSPSDNVPSRVLDANLRQQDVTEARGEILQEGNESPVYDQKVASGDATAIEAEESGDGAHIATLTGAMTDEATVSPDTDTAVVEAEQSAGETPSEATATILDASGEADAHHHMTADSGDAIAHYDADLAQLKAEHAQMGDAIKEEIKRLHMEYAQLRDEVQSKIAALGAERLRLSQELASYRDREDGIIAWEEEAIRLRSKVEEIGEAWAPETVAALEMEKGALVRENIYLKHQLEAKLQQLEAQSIQLTELNPARVKDLRDRIAQLEEENQRLANLIAQQEEKFATVIEREERIRQATRALEQNQKLLTENTTLKIQVERLLAQITHLEVMRSQYVKFQQDNAELRKTIDAYNESEQRRQERSERAFDALRLIVDDGANKSRPSSAPWSSEEEIVKQGKKTARESQFIFHDYQIQWFFAALRSARLIILKGFSGLGKTSLPILMARSLGAGCVVIPVQPSWKSKVDLMGFFNHFDQRFLPTQFTKALLLAQQPIYQGTHFFIILDEMNLSRVEYYFSDFNVKLEDDSDPYVELFDNSVIEVQLSQDGIGEYIRDGNRLVIPPNVTFFGTINDDETTFAISDKIYDRAQVIHFFDIEKSGTGKVPPADSTVRPVSFGSYTGATASWKPVGSEIPSFLQTLNKQVRERFAANLSHRPRIQIQRFIEAYIAANGDPSEALDLQMVSKVLPKIRYSHHRDFQDSLDQFGKTLEQQWPYKSVSKRPDKTLQVLDLMKANI